MTWEIIAVVVFWLLYGPLSFAILQQIGGSLVTLIAILGAGIFLTAAFLAVCLLISRSKQERKNVVSIKQDLEQPPEEEPVLLENVFEPNFGHEELD